MGDAILSPRGEREQGKISFCRRFTKHKTQYFCQTMAVSVMLKTYITPKYDVFPRQEEFSINYNACIPKCMKTSPHPQFEQATMSERKDQGNFKV